MSELFLLDRQAIAAENAELGSGGHASGESFERLLATAEAQQQMTLQVLEPELAGGHGIFGQGILDYR